MKTVHHASAAALFLGLVVGPAMAQELRFANWLPSQHVLNTTVFPCGWTHCRSFERGDRVRRLPGPPTWDARGPL
jgi:hypothetical protein